jgi:N-acyl-L-homoserine lactone synthetase
MVQYSVALFDSTSHVMRSEKLLGQAGVRVKMIPTPRQISSDCGVALRFDREEADRVETILSENRVPLKGVYPI